MLLKIIKDTPNGRSPNAKNLQKLILSSQVQRFRPFQTVLVPCAADRAVCQVVKTAGLHEAYCYVNADVVCLEQLRPVAENAAKSREENVFSESRKEIKEIVSSESTVNEKDCNTENLNEEEGLHEEDLRNEDLGREFEKNQKDEENLNIEWQNEGVGRDFAKKFELSSKGAESNAGLESSNRRGTKPPKPSQDFNFKPNVFGELFLGSLLDLDSVIELPDEAMHCKRVSVSVVVNQFYRGTNEEFNRLVKQVSLVPATH
ncbi:hypothetical protein M8J77_000037 [Diaphorina citri]|nr:hypothetical protein M8J77_000037 [Diaphorina citri]